MLRIAVWLCLVLAVGYVALHLFLGIAGGLIGLVLGLAWLLLKAMVVLALAYAVLGLVAPDAARKVRLLVAGTRGV
ncbi:MAG: hypothetical protein NVSMB23_20250 [Myxococcales bacterium]